MNVAVEQLIASSVLKTRCNEPIRCKCAGCGTTYSENEWSSSGFCCQVCGEVAYKSVCMTCGQITDAINNAVERECLSIKAFNETGRTAFGTYVLPVEPELEISPQPGPTPSPESEHLVSIPPDDMPSPPPPSHIPISEVFASEHMTAKAWDIFETMEGQDFVVGRVVHLIWDFNIPATRFRLSHYHGLYPEYPVTPVTFGPLCLPRIIVKPPRKGELRIVIGEKTTFKLSARMIDKKWITERITIPFEEASFSQNHVLLDHHITLMVDPLSLNADQVSLQSAIKPLYHMMPLYKHIISIPKGLALEDKVLLNKIDTISFYCKTIPMHHNGCINHPTRVLDFKLKLFSDNSVFAWIKNYINRKENDELK